MHCSEKEAIHGRFLMYPILPTAPSMDMCPPNRLVIRLLQDFIVVEVVWIAMDFWLQ